MIEERRLQSLPLGRPPQFKEPATLPPFTAEKKLKDAVVKLSKQLRVSRSEVMRRAMLIGVKQLIADLKAVKKIEVD